VIMLSVSISSFVIYNLCKVYDDSTTLKTKPSGKNNSWFVYDVVNYLYPISEQK